jgi:hypothetical protein
MYSCLYDVGCTRISSCSRYDLITERVGLDIGIVNKRVYSRTILLQDKELYRMVISKLGQKGFVVYRYQTLGSDE